MAYRGVRLIFSLLVFFCCGLLAYGGPSEIKMDLEVKDGLPISSIIIGSNQYKLMLGTWNSDIWIFSKSACKGKIHEAKGHKHDPVARANSAMCTICTQYDDTSDTSEDISKRTTYEGSYLQGKLKGYIIQGTIKIGEHVLLQQSIGIVTDWPSELAINNQAGRFDGYFGLMILQKREGNEESRFFKSLLESKTIPSKRFGIYFNPYHNYGELMLGGINNKLIAGGVDSLKDVPIVSDETGWLINIDSIKIGPTEVARNIKAYVDLSSAAFLGKREIISNINNALGAVTLTSKNVDSKTGKLHEETIFHFKDCWTDKIIVMTINNNKYTLDSSSILLNVLGQFCVPTFQIRESYMEYDLILGTPFLNKYYSVFDAEKKKISFAEAKKGIVKDIEIEKKQENKNKEGNPGLLKRAFGGVQSLLSRKPKEKDQGRNPGLLKRVFGGVQSLLSRKPKEKDQGS